MTPLYCVSGGRDSGPLDLNFNLTSSPGSDIKTQCHLAQVLPPVWAQEHKVNIIRLGSGIETAIIFNSRTENPIIWSSVWQMEQQTHPLPFLSKPIWWLEPQQLRKNTMVGEGRGSARLALFCVKEWCFMKPELVASSPPRKPDTTIEPTGLFEALKHKLLLGADDVILWEPLSQRALATWRFIIITIIVILGKKIGTNL